LNVAYKRYICDKSSIRFTVDYYNKFNDDELVKNETFDDYTTSIINTETKTTNRYLEFKIQYLYDINLNNIVTVFVGGGFFTNNEFSSSEDNYERFTNEILENTTYYKTTTDVWRIGAGIVVGVDCTLYKNITLFAEYEGVINKGWKTWRYGYNYKSEHESNEWGYELKGIKIGVGVNF
jgi:opacity protein-like surface antigen